MAHEKLVDMLHPPYSGVGFSTADADGYGTVYCYSQHPSRNSVPFYVVHDEDQMAADFVRLSQQYLKLILIPASAFRWGF